MYFMHFNTVAVSLNRTLTSAIYHGPSTGCCKHTFPSQIIQSSIFHLLANDSQKDGTHEVHPYRR